MQNTYKLKYVGKAVVQTAYGKFKPGDTFEVDNYGDYCALLRTGDFEKVGPVSMVNKTRNRSLKKIFKKEVDE